VVGAEGARVGILAGLVVGLALIPEATSFSTVAGLDPRVRVFASFTMAVTIAFTGGRPAMISAATGSIALVIAPWPTTAGCPTSSRRSSSAGSSQVGLGLLGAARLMRFVPRSVMVGFVNALAILIFTSQFPYQIHVPRLVYPLLALALAIIALRPRLATIVPAPLIAIVVLTVIAITTNPQAPAVGDKGKLPSSLPTLDLPDIPTPCTLHPAPCRSSRPTRSPSPWSACWNHFSPRNSSTSSLTPTPKRPANPVDKASPTSSPDSSAAWADAR
jgi:SulP family sulfate permease